MPRTPIYKIGQRVIARRPIYNPFTQTVHKTGTRGTIIGTGVDSAFGFYTVNLNGETMMVDVAPASKMAGLEIE